jgi:simple sugar transport system substrate-binding protein
MRRRLTVAARFVALGVVLAACTSTSSTQSSGAPASSSGAVPAVAGGASVTIGVVVHGAVGDQFWSDVKDGVTDAGKLTGATVDCQTSADPDEQGRFISAEVAKKVNVLIVSIPSVDALKAPVAAAQKAGVPVIVVNSGATEWKSLGAVGYVGQDEAVGAQVAGQAMKDAGVKKLLCVNITQVILAVDQRCEGATKTFVGPVETVRIDLGDQAGAPAAIAAKLQQDKAIDGVLSLGGGVYTPSRDGIAQAGSTAKLGTFDVNSDITADLKAGKLLFALDQQPYIQGYQAVVTANLLAQKGLLIGAGQGAVLSGPRLLTKDNVG